ncbi:histidine phosphatase family protein [Vibrio parahaemolyticus]|uniref:histidine phosphatase family protein n=1 Tax=Vibrio mediterranei TaxID=689 RepID=UPI0040684571
MHNILLMRHGKVTAPPALYGSTNVEVAELLDGDTINALLANGPKIHRIHSSPLKRCAVLAQKLASQMNIPLSLMPDIAEMDFGVFDGVPFDAMSAEQWQQLEPFWSAPAEYCLPQGEPLNDFRQRVLKYWDRVINESQDHETTLVIAHGGVIRIVIASVLGLDWANPRLYSSLNIANASLTHFQFDPESPVHIQLKAIGVPPGAIAI